jgi:hypothetical protein
MAPPRKGQALTTLQRALADAWIEAQALAEPPPLAALAELAGYRGTPESLRVIGSRTLRLPAVMDYLRDRTQEMLRHSGVRAALAVQELIGSPKVSARVRSDTSLRLLAGLGMLAPDTHGGGSGSGPALVVNLILPDGAAAPLTQAASEARVIEGKAEDASGEAFRDEEGGALTVRLAGPVVATACEGGGGGGGGGFRDEGRGGGGAAHGSPALTSGGGEVVTVERGEGRKFSGSKKSGGRRGPKPGHGGRPKKVKRSLEWRAKKAAEMKARHEADPSLRERARERMRALRARQKAAKEEGAG